MRIFALIGVLIGLLMPVNLMAQDNNETGEERLNIKELMFHHIGDSHHWNIFAWKGDGGEIKSIDIPLPVMAYNKQNGDFLFAMSSSLSEGQTIEKNGCRYGINAHEKLEVNGSTDAIFDFSLTRNVASMLMSVALLMLIFVGATRSIRKTKVPRGGAVIVEELVLFAKEIADDQIGKKKSAKFTPFLLTLFFFIWINNIIGLVPFFPGGTNLSGNIAFTSILAIFTFIVTHVFASKHYWVHTLTVPGVPFIMKFIMVPLEIVTMFTRPFTLLIRLFANITGGHIIVLSMFSIIFYLQTYMISIASVPLAFVVFVLELIFGALQAYIFTVLSALYIGLAVADGHDE
ncbi:MAG: F0F1 ATP synthase subunit A [Bacteroidales bacterium]|nr:F0F1 ATP synthase subunit A [Bacteroidales bacterium]